MSQNQTIFIHIDSLKIEEGHVLMSSKIRLWPSLIVFTRWVLNQPISQPAIVLNGCGINAINSLAIAIEGFLGDIYYEHICDKKEENPILLNKVMKATWNLKKKYYKTFFGTDISTINSFDTVEILFTLRNNTAHGRTHRITKRSKMDAVIEGETSSNDENYQKVRSFLQGKGLISQSQQVSNIEALWQQPVLNFFLSETKIFLYSVIDNSNPDRYALMREELENAFY